MSVFTESEWLIGSSTTTLTLTASFQDSTKTPTVAGFEQLNYVIIYTPGANTRNLTVRIETNFKNTGWGAVQKGVDASPGSGIIATTVYDNEFVLPGAVAATTYIKSIPVAAGFGQDVVTRVRVKEDGAGDFGTVKVLLSKYTQTVQG